MKSIFTLVVLLISLISAAAEKGRKSHGNERIVVQNKPNDAIFKTSGPASGPAGPAGGGGDATLKTDATLNKDDSNMEFKTFSGNETDSMF